MNGVRENAPKKRQKIQEKVLYCRKFYKFVGVLGM